MSGVGLPRGGDEAVKWIFHFISSLIKASSTSSLGVSKSTESSRQLRRHVTVDRRPSTDRQTIR
jgi:hypothetical protein